MMVKKNELKQLEDKLFSHLFRYQKWYFLLLIFIILVTPLISNFLQNKPLIMGAESYYYLQLMEGKIGELMEEAVVILPILLALGSVLLYLNLARKLGISKLFSLFFLLFLVFSPAFIFTFITVSTYSYFTFLVLLGFLLLVQERKSYQYLSVIPFVLASFLDLFSTLLLLALQITYFYHTKNKLKRLTIPIIGVTVLSLLINLFFLNNVFIAGPFHNQQIFADLIGDLGGLSGISFFLFFLALIGLVIARKEKKIYSAYLFALVLIPIYIYNTQTIFPLTVLISLFATIGFLRLFEKRWVLDTLRKFTLILLILSIFFSTFTYLDRVTLNGPTMDDIEVLQWVKENTLEGGVIFSAPENGYYIEHFAARPAFSIFNTKGETSIVETEEIFSATYVDELFPLLKKNKIEMLYITPKMKEELPADFGLLFLLKNEKFKLVHSQGDTEVWLFKE